MTPSKDMCALFLFTAANPRLGGALLAFRISSMTVFMILASPCGTQCSCRDMQRALNADKH